MCGIVFLIWYRKLISTRTSTRDRDSEIDTIDEEGPKYSLLNNQKERSLLLHKRKFNERDMSE
jgi:hypothetical protein